MGLSRHKYWSGLPFPSPGDLPDPGIEPWSPALQADSLPSEPPGGRGERAHDLGSVLGLSLASIQLSWIQGSSAHHLSRAQYFRVGRESVQGLAGW